MAIQVPFVSRGIEETGSHPNHSGPIEKINSILSEIIVPVVKASAQEAIQLKEQYKAKLNEAYCLVASKLSNGNASERNQYLLLRRCHD